MVEIAWRVGGTTGTNPARLPLLSFVPQTLCGWDSPYDDSPLLRLEPKDMNQEQSIPWRDEELAELRAQVAYWRANYEILKRIIAEQHQDPALHWLDEIVHTRFSKML